MNDVPNFDDITKSLDQGTPVELYTFRGSDVNESLLENNVKSLILGPSHGEFLCAPVRVNRADGTNNASVGGNDPDLVHSVRQMLQTFPNLEHITLTPAFYGNDLRAGECVIAPRVGANHSPPTDAAQAWAVAGTGAGDAVATTNPQWLGTPADWALSACIAYLKKQGLKVSVMPVLLMDIPPDNQLPDPYRAAAVGQPAYPSSNLITGSLTDFMGAYTPFMTHYATLAKAAGADGFIAGKGLDGLIADGAVAPPPERLCGVSGADAFPSQSHTAILRLECDGDTPTEGTATLGGVIRFTANSAFNGKFIFRGSGVNMLGTATQISGGDTGEQEWRIDGFEWDFAWTTNFFNSLKLNEEAGSVFTPALPLNSFTFEFNGELIRHFPSQAETALPALLSALSPIAPDSLGFALSPQNNLTPVGDLIASSTATAFIALTHTFPLSDWRRGREHADKMAGASSQYSLDYLRGNIAGGEGFDWDYADDSDALTQTRQTDPAPSLTNGRKYKDIAGWRLGAPARALKPIVFCEIGCRAVNYGANRYNAGESLPVDALDLPDLLCQRSYSEAVLSYYGDVSNNPVSESGVRFVDLSRCSVREWDMRYHPYALRSGAHPDLTALWPQGWQLNGRARRPSAIASKFGVYRYTTHARDIEYPPGSKIIYKTAQVKGASVRREGDLNTDAIRWGLPFNNPVVRVLSEFRHPAPLTVKILRGHITRDGATAFYPFYSGRVIATDRKKNTINIQTKPQNNVLSRLGVNRGSSLSCPLPLYGYLCKAKVPPATRHVSVEQVEGAPVGDDGILREGGPTITLLHGWNGAFNTDRFVNGYVEWDYIPRGEYAYKTSASPFAEYVEWDNPPEDWDAARVPPRPDGSGILLTNRRRILQVNNNELMMDGFIPLLRWESVNGESAPVIRVILGCDHSMKDCRELHNNLPNFGGCPTLPPKNPYDFTIPIHYEGDK